MTRRTSGFTLLEFLTALGVLIAVIAVAVLVLNPRELLRQARDAQRIADVAQFAKTIELMRMGNKSTGTPGQVVYVSAQATTSDCADHSALLPVLAAGWVFECPTTDPYAIDGTGWLPFDFRNNEPPATLAVLPIDPLLDPATGMFYFYLRGGRGFEFVSGFESGRYLSEYAGQDGGFDPARLERGSNITLWKQAGGF